jgi:hypothetical protein
MSARFSTLSSQHLEATSTTQVLNYVGYAYLGIQMQRQQSTNCNISIKVCEMEKEKHLAHASQNWFKDSINVQYKPHKHSSTAIRPQNDSRKSCFCKPGRIVMAVLAFSKLNLVKPSLECIQSYRLQGLSHCATSRRVSGSIPSGVAGDFFRSYRRNHVPWGRPSL